MFNIGPSNLSQLFSRFGNQMGQQGPAGRMKAQMGQQPPNRWANMGNNVGAMARMMGRAQQMNPNLNGGLRGQMRPDMGSPQPVPTDGSPIGPSNNFQMPPGLMSWGNDAAMRSSRLGYGQPDPNRNRDWAAEGYGPKNTSFTRRIGMF